MTPLPIFDDLTKILFVLVLATAALIITVRTVSSLFNIYAVQSWLIAGMALVLYLKTGSGVLLALAILTVASKAFLIPYVLKRIQRTMQLKRDVEFRYLTPISSVLVGTALIFLVYRSFSRFLVEMSGEDLFFFGAVIGVSLTLMGMMVIITRKRMITKIIGYLTMENGVLLFSLFIAELPFIIELLIIIDLVMLILLATILAFGIDSTIDDFHTKLNSFTTWFKD
ncbi:MAG: hydrogenase subunit [Dehalococcoidales bacterium]|nr:hydrogenase subunit [Dehalococcoidales bacterium]